MKKLFEETGPIKTGGSINTSEYWRRLEGAEGDGNHVSKGFLRRLRIISKLELNGDYIISNVNSTALPIVIYIITYNYCEIYLVMGGKFVIYLVTVSVINNQII